MTRTIPLPGDLTPPTDPYEFQTYKILLQRGKPQAEAIEKARFWGALKRADQAEGKATHGPADHANWEAALDAKYYGNPRFETDPATGRREYKGSMDIGIFPVKTPPQAASYSIGSTIGSPPTIMEYNRSQWIGMRTPVDRYSLNPGGDYYAEIPGPAPEMFSTGPLPLVTASGVDPGVLRWVAWQLRTSAAYAETRGQVLGFIELSALGDPDGFEGHVTTLGGEELKRYWGRIATWVATPVDTNAPLTEDDYKSFYPDEQTE
jgi:hypothetical protein